jgi:Methyltransferase domain
MLFRRRPTKSTLLFLLFGIIVIDAGVTLALGLTAGIVATGALAGLAAVSIIHVYFALSAKLDEHARLLAPDPVRVTRQVQSLFDVYSMLKLRHPLPPMGDMAISPDFAATLVSLILKHRPKTILEFGSGTSTLLCGYCLEQIGEGRIISIDHETQYADQTRESLREHGVDQFAQVISAPLREVTLPAGKWKWYDTAFLSDLPRIDLMIVDGPPTWTGDLARYPAMPVLIEHLGPSSMILVDDANRPDEQKMVDRWLSEFPGFTRSNLPHEKGTVLLKRTAAGSRSGAA